MYTNISKSKDGFNSARLVAKMGEKEYMSISYEWEGDGVPSFAMDLMGFMQASEMKSGKVRAGYEEAYADFIALGKEMKEKEEMCEECGKPMEKCACKKEKSKKGKDGTKPVPGDTTKKHMPNTCPDCGQKSDDCTCDGKKQLEKTREKKGKDKKA
jgi:hypothetical protein